MAEDPHSESRAYSEAEIVIDTPFIRAGTEITVRYRIPRRTFESGTPHLSLSTSEGEELLTYPIMNPTGVVLLSLPSDFGPGIFRLEISVGKTTVVHTHVMAAGTDTEAAVEGFRRASFLQAEALREVAAGRFSQALATGQDSAQAFADCGEPQIGGQALYDLAEELLNVESSDLALKALRRAAAAFHEAGDRQGEENATRLVEHVCSFRNAGQKLPGHIVEGGGTSSKEAEIPERVPSGVPAPALSTWQRLLARSARMVATTASRHVGVRVLSLGLPIAAALGLSFVFPLIYPLAGALAVVVIFVVYREARWLSQEALLKRLRRRLEEFIHSEESIASTLKAFSERFTQEWYYEELHLTFWLDQDEPSSGRRERKMTVRFGGDTPQLLACVGKIRLGARGDGTALVSLDSLVPQVSCNRSDVFCLLLPTEVDVADEDERRYWQEFTVFLYAPRRKFSTLELTVSAKWENLWAPLWRHDRDDGVLLLDEASDLVVIDVVAPKRSAKGDFVMKPISPEACLYEDIAVEHEYDPRIRRQRMRLVVKNAQPGLYRYEIVREHNPNARG